MAHRKDDSIPPQGATEYGVVVDRSVPWESNLAGVIAVQQQIIEALMNAELSERDREWILKSAALYLASVPSAPDSAEEVC